MSPIAFQPNAGSVHVDPRRAVIATITAGGRSPPGTRFRSAHVLDNPIHNARKAAYRLLASPALNRSPTQ